MTAQRMVFLTFAAVVGTGIWHTGFDKASWILYIPVALAMFAGTTGVCPSLIIWKKCGFK